MSSRKREAVTPAFRERAMAYVRCTAFRSHSGGRAPSSWTTGENQVARVPLPAATVGNRCIARARSPAFRELQRPSRSALLISKPFNFPPQHPVVEHEHDYRTPRDEPNAGFPERPEVRGGRGGHKRAHCKKRVDLSCPTSSGAYCLPVLASS